MFGIAKREAMEKATTLRSDPPRDLGEQSDVIRLLQGCVVRVIRVH